MKYSLYLGKILGIKIYVHWTFVLLVGWIVLMNLSAGLGPVEIIRSLGLVLAVFGCIVLHELGHAVAARRYKVKTKFITLLPIGGIAQLETMPEIPKQELFIALAGPAVNVLIGLILFPFVDIHSLLRAQSVTTPGPFNILTFLFAVNVSLALFNLIPAFPMDGGRALRAILAFRWGRAKATKIAFGIGQLFGAAFVLIGFISNPVLTLIGLFILFGGRLEFSMVQTTQLLHQYTVNDVLMREIPTMDSNLSIRDAAQILLNTQNKNFVVVANGKAEGTISRDAIIIAMQKTGENALVEEVTDKDLSYVTQTMPLDEAWKIMQQSKKPLILVGTSAQLTGVVEQDNIAEFILLHQHPGTK